MQGDGGVRCDGRANWAFVDASNGRTGGLRGTLLRAALGAALAAAVGHGTASRAAAVYCAGDCDRDGAVSTAEADLCEDLLLNGIPSSGNPCPECDCNGDTSISAGELNLARGNVGETCDPGQCPPPTPTPRPTLAPTSSVPTATVLATQTPTIGATSTPQETPQSSPTVAPTGVATPCVGNCDGNGVVSISELLRGVNIALGRLALDQCPAFDRSGNGGVEVGELIAAVGNALNGCR